jgi:hypothetical protein
MYCDHCGADLTDGTHHSYCPVVTSALDAPLAAGVEAPEPEFVYAPSREAAQKLLDESYLKRYRAVPEPAGVPGQTTESNETRYREALEHLASPEYSIRPTGADALAMARYARAALE